jgi:predicted ArsR family transcriptional regulator
MLELTETRKEIIQAMVTLSRITKDDLADRIEKPRITVYDNLKVLEKHGLVERTFENRTNSGRPKTYWELTERIANRMVAIGFLDSFVDRLLLGLARWV